MYKHILVPVDIAEPALAKAALAQAVTFAKISKGDIKLVYIRSLIPVTYMEYAPADFDKLEEVPARELLASMAAGLDYPQNKVTTAVRLGSVYSEVLAVAKDMKADLIVVGSQRPTMATYLLGSNAKTIVRHALCSVLVVREAGAQQ
jgi:universal stress protein F